MTAGQILAGDAEAAIGCGAAGVDHRMMMTVQFVVGEVAADVDVAMKTEAAAAHRDAFVGEDHVTARGVVRRDAGACQAAGCGQPFVEIDLDTGMALEQLGRGIEAGWPAADDGHAQCRAQGAFLSCENSALIAW